MVLIQNEITNIGVAIPIRAVVMLLGKRLKPMELRTESVNNETLTNARVPAIFV